MADSFPDDNLISTLEKSLRQTRNQQQRLLVRLHEVESEAESLKKEIQALENFAEQTEATIYSLLAPMRTGNQHARDRKKISIDDDYELPSDLQRFHAPQRNDRTESALNEGHQRYLGGYEDSRSHGSSSRNLPSIIQDIEPISRRFSDRTITQACTLLLGESGEPLHVNELYNLLVSGGFEFKGNNPTISIAVSLNRNRRFRKVAPGTFDLVMRDASKAS